MLRFACLSQSAVVRHLSKGKWKGGKSFISLQCQVWYGLLSNQTRIKANHVHCTECWLSSTFKMLVLHHHFSLRDKNASFGSFKCKIIFSFFLSLFPAYQSPVWCNIRKNILNMPLVSVFANSYDDVKVISTITFPKPFLSCWSKTRAELL